jgi:TP901 family phage tail tape measure protein
MPNEKIEAILSVKGASSMVKSFKSIGGSLIVINQGLELAKKVFNAIAVPINEVTQAVRLYEKALLGVQKTTNISNEKLNVFSASVKQLSKDLKGAAGSKQLLEIAQSAGQLGVRGSENLLLFSETIAKLGIASDLAGDAAATTLARITTVTGEGTAKIDIFASQLVALGNNFAATESEIARVANEVARATAVFNVSAGDSAALGAALKSIGVRAELGGSAVGRAFRVIDKAVRQGGQTMQDMSVLTGVTGDKLKQVFQQDSVAAFQLFIEGLGKIADANGDVTGELEKFGLKGEEILKVLPVLAKNSSLLASTLKTVKEETLNGGAAIQKEYSIAVNSLDSKIKNLDQRFNGLKVTVGETFGSMLKDSVDTTTGMITAFDNFFKTINERTKLRKEKNNLIAFGKQIGFVFERGIRGSIQGTQKDLDKLAGLFAQMNNSLRSRAGSQVEAAADAQKEKEEAIELLKVKEKILQMEVDRKEITVQMVEFQQSMIDLTQIEKELRMETDRVAAVSLAQRKAKLLELLEIQESAQKLIGEKAEANEAQLALAAAQIRINSIAQRAKVERDITNRRKEAVEEEWRITIEAATIAAEIQRKSSRERANVMKDILYERQRAMDETAKKEIEAAKEAASIAEVSGSQRAFQMRKLLREQEEANKRIAEEQLTTWDKLKAAWSSFSTDFGDVFAARKNISAGTAAGQLTARVGGQITGVSGAISGFQAGGPWGAAAGFAADILLSNEEFAEALGEISLIIQEMFAPIITEMIPILRAVGRVLRVLAPLIAKLTPAIVMLAKAIVWMVDVYEKAFGWLAETINKLNGTMEQVNGGMKSLSNALADLLKPIDKLIKALSPGNGGGAAGDYWGKFTDGVKDLLSGNPVGQVPSFAKGTDFLRASDLLRFPGMEAGSGLIKAHVGEAVVTAEDNQRGTNQFTFNISGGNAQENALEIRRLIEEMQLTGRLR